MPELPEVETTVRGLKEAIVGRRVREVEVTWERTLANASPAELGAALAGVTIADVTRRGKHVVLHFADGAALAVHRRMTGNLLVRPPGAPTEPYTRLTLRFDDGSELRFVDIRKFGRASYHRDQAALAAFFAQVAGPEPLEDLTPQRLAALLARRRGRLKPLLLDQTFLAGIGNIYADEILWTAGLHPERRADSLAPAEIGRLADAIRDVLLAAIERRGTSLRDYRDSDGERGDNQRFLAVYGRVGAPCPRCGAPIEKRWLGQRGTHVCPRCQPIHAGPPPDHMGETRAGERCGPERL